MAIAERIVRVVCVGALLTAACATAGTPPGGSASDVPDLDAVTVELVEVGSAEAPTGFAMRPGSRELYVTEQQGRVRRLGDGVVLDLSDEVEAGPVGKTDERGMLDLAFSPDGAHLYLSYTANAPEERVIRRIVEYTMDGDGVDTDSSRLVLEYRKRYPQHNGGAIRFGPDGYLYAGFGDGAPVRDVNETGQDPSDVLASIVRIDPRGTDDGKYSVPDDNPFVGRDGFAPEVWLFGVRNPWQFSFDRQTGDLWVGDVGESAFEEISHLPAPSGAGRGANLGWSALEGLEPTGYAEVPDDHVLPVFTYGRDRGCAVIGGFVYRGVAIEALRGAYLFTDLCNGDLRALVVDGVGTVVEERSLGVEVERPSAFGEDLDGELYVLSLKDRIYRIAPAE